MKKNSIRIDKVIINKQCSIDFNLHISFYALSFNDSNNFGKNLY